MELLDLKNDIKEGKLQKLYIFTGPEQVIADTYIHKIAEISKKEVKYCYSMAEIYNTLTMVRLDGQSFVYIISEDKELLSKEVYWNAILEGKLGNHIIILRYHVMDKRKKFYTTFKDYIVNFEKLSSNVVQNMILKRYKSLNEDDVFRLVNRCVGDYGRTLLSMDKVERLSKINNEDISTSLNKALEENLINIDAQDVLQDFLDCMVDADYEMAFFYYYLMRSYGEAELKIITYLYNTFRAIYQIQSHGSKNVFNIARDTGLYNQVIETYLNKTNIYETEDLIDILQLLRKCETDIKSGKIDNSIVMDKCLVDIFFIYNGIYGED